MKIILGNVRSRGCRVCDFHLSIQVIKYISYGHKTIKDFLGHGKDGIEYDIFSTGSHMDRKQAHIRHTPKLGALEILKYVGPGFIVTIGFIDPGNWAANVAAGSIYGYNLLWMVTLSTIMLIFYSIMPHIWGLLPDSAFLRLLQNS